MDNKPYIYSSHNINKRFEFQVVVYVTYTTAAIAKSQLINQQFILLKSWIIW